MRTHIGERETDPEFGVLDLTFKRLPINPISLLNELSASEPRARLLAEEFPEAFDELKDRIAISATRAEDSPSG